MCNNFSSHSHICNAQECLTLETYLANMLPPTNQMQLGISEPLLLVYTLGKRTAWNNMLGNINNYNWMDPTIVVHRNGVITITVMLVFTLYCFIYLSHWNLFHEVCNNQNAVVQRFHEILVLK